MFVCVCVYSYFSLINLTWNVFCSLDHVTPLSK